MKAHFSAVFGTDTSVLRDATLPASGLLPADSAVSGRQPLSPAYCKHMCLHTQAYSQYASAENHIKNENLRRGRQSVTCFILFSFRPGKKLLLAANQRGGGSLLAETKSSLPVSWDNGSGLKQLREAPPDHGWSISWAFSCRPGFSFHGTLDPFPLLSQPMFQNAKKGFWARGGVGGDQTDLHLLLEIQTLFSH